MTKLFYEKIGLWKLLVYQGFGRIDEIILFLELAKNKSFGII